MLGSEEASEAGILSGAGGVLIAETKAEAREAPVAGEALITEQGSKVSVKEATAFRALIKKDAQLAVQWQQGLERSGKD